MKINTIKVFENLRFHFELQDLIKAIGKIARVESLKQEICWSYEVIEKHIQAVAVVGLFPIAVIDQHKAVIYGNDFEQIVTLNIGAEAELLFQARLAQISVLTLGSEIDSLRKRIQANRMNLRSYILDIASVLALKYSGQAVNRIAEKEADRRGWGVGYRMSPGSLNGWPLTDQGRLCELLHAETIGVHLKPSAMLSPLKSVTALIGMGPDYSSKNVKSACKWCRRKMDCVSC
ncbi:MAG: hypothetical protein GY874_10745 [Desulfobacteraceae bacterium]|nr:hypothetical protein [Desulfobacteraceae bacterium]